MTKKLFAGASALTFVALLAAAAPSQATSIASYSASTNNFTFTNTAGVGTISGKTAVTSVVLEGLTGAPFDAELIWTGASVGTAVGHGYNRVTHVGASFDQNISGTFQLIYDDTTQTIGGKKYTNQSTVLLSGSFTNADMHIGGTTGTITCNSCASNFASDVITVTGSTAESFSLALAGVPANVALSSNIPGTFSAETFGGFSATLPAPIVTPPVHQPSPTPAPVPEPLSWALMLVGFGAVGGMMRRRKLVAAA